jgi:four helix bundle protein
MADTKHDSRHENLKLRTKEFAVRVLNLVDNLPNTLSARTIGGQLSRSGTSVAANYRSACRARSNADFISKLTVVEEETDESAFWIELLIAKNLVKSELVTDLLDEADQLTAIWVSSINTARGKKRELRTPQSALRT